MRESGSYTAEFGLPPIDQVGYVVRNLDETLETFGPLFGPFVTMESALEGTNYRGHASDVTLRMAFGKSGPIEIELIEWVSGDSPHKEALDAGNEGIHHVRFSIDADISTYQPLLEKEGFSVVWSHNFPGSDIEWAYLEGPGGRGQPMIELYKNPHS
jgi:methylmalonyl-CoA/ethylmalonyl-CoA epimerase